VGKRFGGVQALTDVSLSIGRGEIHGLVGENGAGKSTLGKILAGVTTADEGEVWLDGHPVAFRSPHDALASGVTMIAQEIVLVPQLRVVDNVFLGLESHRGQFVDRRGLHQRYQELQETTGFDLPPDELVGHLRLADQQKVEVLRAVARGAKLVVMDEPTAPLTADEARRLFDVIRTLRDRGTTIVYVSHFLREVLSLADRVTVLKDGRVVRTAPVGEETPESLVTAMLGRSLDVQFPERPPISRNARVALAVRGLRRADVLHDISFDVRAGEILGIAGLIGSGRSELARCIFGADPRDAGEILLDGMPTRVRSPRDAVRAGIVMLPESRKEQGLVMGRPVIENVTLASLSEFATAGGLVSPGRERAAARSVLADVGVPPDRMRVPVSQLSGGNQQKTLFAKWLLRKPRAFIADEPTRGVDVGAKRAIYELLAGLAADGIAVIVISSDLEEVLELAHRVLVMREGRLAAEFDAKNVTEEQVMTAAFAAHTMKEAAA
jgi:ABC-type sugar transport system ATPase subunit